jgi:hypothetical protein
MAHAQLQRELDESKLEIQKLRMSLGAPTVHKDLSLISLTPKWSGSESSNSLEEFISTLEASARIGRWDARDTLKIAALKLEGSARVFYQGCTQLHAREASWDFLKKHSEKGTKTCIRTSTITPGYRWQHRAETKARRNFPIDVGRWRRELHASLMILWFRECIEKTRNACF